jgi:AcrR family transcriptional regulator
VPKLWTETIGEHRRAVRDATLDTAAALVAEHGLASVTMSRIAAETGIGRATLYKYFPDVESILLAWHQRHVEGHLAQLAEVRDQARTPGLALAAVVRAYALIAYRRPRGTELAALVHRGEEAGATLRELFAGLLADAARAGEARDDVRPAELAAYCVSALAAAAGLPSEAAVGRLVSVTLDGWRAGR